jgi:hypothetical protein
MSGSGFWTRESGSEPGVMDPITQFFHNFDTGLPLQKILPVPVLLMNFLFLHVHFFIYKIQKREKKLKRWIQRWKSQRIKIHRIAYRFLQIFKSIP